MLNRRLIITGGLFAPAIVRASSIMPISVLAIAPPEKMLRWIARVSYREGGSSTFIGETPFSQWRDFPTIVRDTVNSRTPWNLFPAGLIEVHVLRADESAFASDLYAGPDLRQKTLDSKLEDDT